MATVALTGHNYDGILSTVTFTFTGTGNGHATTTSNVIGQIVQVGIARVGAGDLVIEDFRLTDNTNSCQLTDIAGVGAADLMPDDINSGGGGFCRGLLNLYAARASGTSGDTITATVYYIKM